MSISKKICVIFRGKLSEWNNAKTSIFESCKRFEAIHDVYYLMVVWDDEGVNRQDLIHDFANRNLIDVRILNRRAIRQHQIGNFALNQSYEEMSYVRHFACMQKRLFERINGFIFDEVIETRPDVFLVPAKEENLGIGLSHIIPDNTLYIPGGISLRTNFGKPIQKISDLKNNVRPFTDDNLIISNSRSHDMLNSQFNYFKETASQFPDRLFIDPHNLMAEHCVRCGLKVENKSQYYFDHYVLARNDKLFSNSIDFKNVSLSTARMLEAENRRIQEETKRARGALLNR